MLRLADLHESNHQLESRVREIRLPGSEGGALVTNVPTPIRHLAGRYRSPSLPFPPQSVKIDDHNDEAAGDDLLPE